MKAIDPERYRGPTPATARLLCLGLPLLLPACRTYISYVGTPLADRAEAKRVIRQTLEEQRNERAPVSVDVTDERFLAVQTRQTEAENAGIFGVAVYYARIGRVGLSLKKRVYTMFIYAADGALLLHVFTYDRASAERFMDALATMRRGTSLARSNPRSAESGSASASRASSNALPGLPLGG